MPDVIESQMVEAVKDYYVASAKDSLSALDNDPALVHTATLRGNTVIAALTATLEIFVAGGKIDIEVAHRLVQGVALMARVLHDDELQEWVVD